MDEALEFLKYLDAFNLHDSNLQRLRSKFRTAISESIVRSLAQQLSDNKLTTGEFLILMKKIV